MAAAEHLLFAYREMAVAGAHLGKVPGDPDRPTRKEIQRVAAQVMNVIGALAPGLLEAIEADAAGGAIPSMRDDPEVRAYLADEAYVGLQLDGFDQWWDRVMAEKMLPGPVPPPIARWFCALAYDCARKVPHVP